MSAEWALPDDGKIPICQRRLKELQTHFGKITQKDLARRIRLGERRTSGYFNGERIPYAKYLGVLNSLGITDLRQLDSRYADKHIPLAELLEPVSSLPLSLPSTEWDPSWMPPGALLRADLGVVEFHMRERELKELENWCIGRERLLVQLCHGPGGMGKTRLAIELCRRMKQFKWRTGFLDKDQFQQDAELWRKALEVDEPLLLVLDYAQDHADTIRWLLEQVTETKGGRVRLLLLARKRGEWLERLKSQAPAREIFTGPAFSNRSLSPISVAKEDRRRSWDIANRDLSKALRVLPVAKPPENLDADYFQQVLLLQMSVLACLDGVEVGDENGLLDYVLQRERSFWTRQLRMNRLPEWLVIGLGQVMAAVTLNMGVETEADGLQIFQGLPFFSGQPAATLHALNRILSDCYPGTRWIEPLQPELLGDHLCSVTTDDVAKRKMIYELFPKH